MTPDPDPPTPPEPETNKFSVSVTNNLNNTYMTRIVYVDTSFQNAELLGGGTAVINQWHDLGEISTEHDTGFIQFRCKAYNNSYPNYDDAYYNGAEVATSVNLVGLIGKRAKFTVTGSGEGSVVIE